MIRIMIFSGAVCTVNFSWKDFELKNEDTVKLV